jgi:hypothetical protein
MAGKVHRSWRQAKSIVVFQLLRYEALKRVALFRLISLLGFDDTARWQPVGHDIRL